MSLDSPTPPKQRVSSSFPDHADLSPVPSFAEPLKLPTHHENSDPSQRDLHDSDDNDDRTFFLASPKPPPPTSKWRLPPLYKKVLKCTLAYFIGSLFTFSPWLAELVSRITSSNGVPSPTGHLIATVAVYYNPAKTIGAMTEADAYCSLGVFYSAFISLASMSMYWFLEVRDGWQWLADLLVLVWIALGMSLIAWMKVWMSKPSFNTACSMMAIIIFIVVVKEGGLEMLLQVAFLVFLGAAISNIVCFTVWPESAASMLQDDIIRTLDSFSTLLSALTQSFLLDSAGLSGEKVQLAVEAHQKSFTSLKRDLSEAYSEWFWTEATRSTQAYDDAVDSLNRLAQHLGGLRSGVKLQSDIINSYRSQAQATERSTPSRDDGGADQFDAALAVFVDLVKQLDPTVQGLSTQFTRAFKQMSDAFVNPRWEESQIEQLAELAEDIRKALFQFESTSNHAVLNLYRRSASIDSENSSKASVLWNESEGVFLIYFFIFTLQEFGQELLSLVDAMSRIYMVQSARAARPSIFVRVFRYFIPRSQPAAPEPVPVPDPASQKSPRRPGTKRSLTNLINQARGDRAPFPRVQPHAPNTVQTPSMSSLSFTGRLKRMFWALGAKVKEPGILYAIKAGLATAILAAPAFFETTRPLFVEYRGEWALISFFVVISPTIGATNFLSLHRIGGTLLGAAFALGVYSLFPSNPVVLSIAGALFSLPCFWLIVAKPPYATSGRFILLTYNLTCLFCYNSRGEDLKIWTIAYHRVAAVILGVIWAFLVSQLWWPSEARKELMKSLSDLCLNMGWLYNQLVTAYSIPPEALNRAIPADTHELSRTASGLNPLATSQLETSIREFQAMELHLQLQLIHLEGLLAQTQHEPRLKGPFPIAMYRGILRSLQTILDRLHSMRCVTTRADWFTSVRRDFIIPVNRERREMVGNVLLYFSTLSSAFRLKTPLPPYLPPAEKSRQRLVEAIRNLDIVRNRDVQGSRQLLYHAYALSMQSVIHELDYLGRTLQEAFGVIGQTAEDFERLFRALDMAT
ncbi:hypothetical protein SISSUDRAFT_981821 [Sistotremastrum suecicum HHB10207 ss-3]|uniref:Uncharacterized protein n=1 Tax=Sistotremastrum suecicum HHB10207 ss-3 TaxID=1314776 RepID=A0A166GAE9_9AGAM|nr:hypothetical protein SISSUDRAFT_981821 [Sistotremastrum suecicum HHB10207 ss-3]